MAHFHCLSFSEVTLVHHTNSDKVMYVTINNITYKNVPEWVGVFVLLLFVFFLFCSSPSVFIIVCVVILSLSLPYENLTPPHLLKSKCFRILLPKVKNRMEECPCSAELPSWCTRPDSLSSPLCCKSAFCLSACRSLMGLLL